MCLPDAQRTNNEVLWAGQVAAGGTLNFSVRKFRLINVYLWLAPVGCEGRPSTRRRTGSVRQGLPWNVGSARSCLECWLLAALRQALSMHPDIPVLFLLLPLLSHLCSAEKLWSGDRKSVV